MFATGAAFRCAAMGACTWRGKSAVPYMSSLAPFPGTGSSYMFAAAEEDTGKGVVYVGDTRAGGRRAVFVFLAAAADVDAAAAAAADCVRVGAV